MFLDSPATLDDVPDVAFAVNGIASDAELRRVAMTRLELDEFVELARQSVVTVRVGSDAPPCAFLPAEECCNRRGPVDGIPHRRRPVRPGAAPQPGGRTRPAPASAA